MVFKHFFTDKNKNLSETFCSFCDKSLKNTKFIISYAHTHFKLNEDLINIHLVGLCRSCVENTQYINKSTKYNLYMKKNFNDFSYIFNYQKKRCILIPNVKNEPIFQTHNDVETILIGFIQKIKYYDMNLYYIKKYLRIPIQEFLYEYGYIDPWNTCKKKPKGYIKLSNLNKNKHKCYICGISENVSQDGIIKLCNNKKCYFQSKNFGFYEYISKENK